MTATAKDIANAPEVKILLDRIDRLQRENAALRQGHEKIVDGYGPNHMSAFCRETSRTALASTGGEHHAE